MSVQDEWRKWWERRKATTTMAYIDLQGAAISERMAERIDQLERQVEHLERAVRKPFCVPETHNSPPLMQKVVIENESGQGNGP